MRMYPAYKLRDVLSEYAIVFFTLLNEGYRLESRHFLILSRISDLPSMSELDRKIFYRELQWSSSSPDDILKPSGEGSSPAEIKKVLRG